MSDQSLFVLFAGPAYANIKLESLTDSCEICNDISVSLPSFFNPL